MCIANWIKKWSLKYRCKRCSKTSRKTTSDTGIAVISGVVRVHDKLTYTITRYKYRKPQCRDWQEYAPVGAWGFKLFRHFIQCGIPDKLGFFNFHISQVQGVVNPSNVIKNVWNQNHLIKRLLSFSLEKKFVLNVTPVDLEVSSISSLQICRIYQNWNLEIPTVRNPSIKSKLDKFAKQTKQTSIFLQKINKKYFWAQFYKI